MLGMPAMQRVACNNCMQHAAHETTALTLSVTDTVANAAAAVQQRVTVRETLVIVKLAPKYD